MAGTIYDQLEDNKKTLVVEDDPTMRMMLEEALSLKGYDVESFATGHEGWEAFEHNLYQLIILDWKLPDMTGVELCEKIRASEHSDYISIIMITSNNTPEHLQMAFDAGADDYLTKPFPLSLLEIRLLIAEQRAYHRRERAKAEEALLRTQQLAAVGTLAAGVAHEFNNIHTSVIGYLQLTLNCKIDDEAREYVNRVLGAAKRAVGITKNLLTFTRSSISGRKLSSFNDIVRDTINLVSKEMKSEGISLKVEFTTDIPKVFCDAGQIGQVIMNLIINARHALYEQKNKNIIIKTGFKEGYSFVSIEDTGMGIPEEDKQKLFIPFFSTKGEYARKNSTLSGIKGTGLGLSVCDTIARNHNGKIEFESDPGKGSIFTLLLPQSITRDAESEKLHLAKIPDVKGRILILDDEEDIRELLEVLLKNKGHDVVSTDDGEEAIKIHQEKPFDLALVDLQMPKLNGFDFMTRIEDLSVKSPDFIVITGRFTSGNLTKSRNIKNIIMTVKKPFDIYEICDTISFALAKEHEKHPAV